VATTIHDSCPVSPAPDQSNREFALPAEGGNRNTLLSTRAIRQFIAPTPANRQTSRRFTKKSRPD
jgi:hypothetical protein